MNVPPLVGPSAPVPEHVRSVGVEGEAERSRVAPVSVSEHLGWCLRMTRMTFIGRTFIAQSTGFTAPVGCSYKDVNHGISMNE